MVELISIIGSKTCTRCGVHKSFAEFPKDKHLKDGHNSWCRTCYAEKSRAWSKQNPERARARFVRWSKENAEHKKAYDRRWVEEHRERSRETSRIGEARRRATPKGRLNGRMAAAIYTALKKNKRGRKWEHLVGYTLEALQYHLEKQFKDGMSWDNMGEWHIDHIIPRSAFNYTHPEDLDFKRCWGLRNLRPLWAKDNMVKNDKIDRPFQPSLTIGACA